MDVFKLLNDLPTDLQNVVKTYYWQMVHTQKFALTLEQIRRSDFQLDLGYCQQWLPESEAMQILNEIAWEHIPDWEVLDWSICVYRRGSLIIYNDWTHLQQGGSPRKKYLNVPYITSKDVEMEINNVWADTILEHDLFW